jgi:hypothetical protein
MNITKNMLLTSLDLLCSIMTKLLFNLLNSFFINSQCNYCLRGGANCHVFSGGQE